MLTQASIEHLPLAENSVDLIFTDPPYARKFLPCYDWLAREAMRILKPGGFVLAMCGGKWNGPIHSYFMNAGLECFFDIAVPMENGRSSAYLWHYGINVRSKFILSYSKGAGTLRAAGMHNMYIGRRDKLWHHWGQDVDHARYFIDYFSFPGDLVLDPFIGGGTTAIACELIGRRWAAFDIDPTALRTTRARLSGAEIPYALSLFSEIEAVDR